MTENPFGVCLEPKCTEEKQSELPSFMGMAKGLMGSVKDIAGGALQGDGLLVTDEVYNTRMSICQSCEFFRQDDKRCSQCGCFMEVKSKFKKTYCPVHRWGAE